MNPTVGAIHLGSGMQWTGEGWITPRPDTCPQCGIVWRTGARPTIRPFGSPCGRHSGHQVITCQGCGLEYWPDDADESCREPIPMGTADHGWTGRTTGPVPVAGTGLTRAVPAEESQIDHRSGAECSAPSSPSVPCTSPVLPAEHPEQP